MFTTADPTTVRRISPSLEIHARVAPRGRWAHVIGRDDLIIVVGLDAARLSRRRRVHSVPPTLITTATVGDAVVLELGGPAQCRAIYVAPGALARAADLPVEAADERTPERRIVSVIARPGICEAADRVTSAEELARLLDGETLSRRLRLASREPVPHPVVWRARDHLFAAYARKVTLDELAAVVGMRRFALAHAFTREVGMPPHAYQTHVRVQHARELIGCGRLLSTVSVEVGFADQSHLTRHFKRVLGLTPGRYARAVTGNVEALDWGTRVSTLQGDAGATTMVRTAGVSYAPAHVPFNGTPSREHRLVASWSGGRP